MGSGIAFSLEHAGSSASGSARPAPQPEPLLRFSAGLLTFLALALVLGWSIWPLIPREVASARAPAGSFSAERAQPHLRAIASEPHPVGTPENARVRDYLISQLIEWNAAHHPEPIEFRSLGDSPAISLILNPRGGVFRTIPAPRFGREGGYLPGSGHPIRVFETVDVRYLLEDMFAKIRRFGRKQSQREYVP